jgi:predicted small secreted protein
MKFKYVISALVLGCFALSACNTVKGIGRDVKSVGKKVEDVGD